MSFWEAHSIFIWVTNIGTVFECVITEEQKVRLIAELSSIIDSSKDSIRIYYLGNNYLSKVEQLGKETTYDISGDLIV